MYSTWQSLYYTLHIGILFMYMQFFNLWSVTYSTDHTADRKSFLTGPVLMYLILLKFLGKSEINIASQLLQFIFLGDGGFRFPVAHFATNTCHASILYFKFWEGVLLMKRFGFRQVSQHKT